MRKPGQFKEEQKRHRRNQSLWNAFKRAKNGEENVWVTVPDQSGVLHRVKLMSGQWEEYTDYASENGCRYAIININKTPTILSVEGKDGKVYAFLTKKDCTCGKHYQNLKTECAGHSVVSNVFWSKICLARVAEMHLREITE